MKKSVWWLIVIIIIILGGWYLWGRSGSQQPAGTNGAATSTPLVSVAHDATLGDYLVAENGMTLYHDSNDTSGVSNCTGPCANNWPPYIVSSTAPLVAATATGTLGTLVRDDGSVQLTYNGAPLYFWKNDGGVGSTTGQGVGGVWSVVSP